VADLEGLSEHAAEHIVAAAVDDDRDGPAALRSSDTDQLRSGIRNAVEVAMSEVLRARLPPEHYSTDLLAALSGAVFGELEATGGIDAMSNVEFRRAALRFAVKCLRNGPQDRNPNPLWPSSTYADALAALERWAAP
jgi:hypothetical protein